MTIWSLNRQIYQRNRETIVEKMRKRGTKPVFTNEKLEIEHYKVENRGEERKPPFVPVNRFKNRCLHLKTALLLSLGERTVEISGFI